MKRILIALAAIAFAPSIAQAEGVNISARASTLGLGGEIGYAFNDYVNLRLGLNDYSRDYDTTEDGIRYNFDFQLESTALMLDVHPFAGGFRMTAGILDNSNELDGQAEATGTYDINGVNYSGSDVGTLYSNVQLGRSNPLYVGVGWTKALADSGWGFGFDLGMVLMGDSEVELTATGPITNDPDFESNLEAEERSAEDDINDSFENYPVIALGLTYQF